MRGEIEMERRERFENLKDISAQITEKILSAEIPITSDEIPTLIKLIEINLDFYTGSQSRTSFKIL